MIIKAKSKPLCRVCGKGITKEVRTLFFGLGNSSDDMKQQKPRSREELQRLTNGEIVSVRWSNRDGDRHIWRAGVWDGESWSDDLFCTNRCAIRYARFAVKHHPELQTQRYADALKKAKSQ